LIAALATRPRNTRQCHCQYVRGYACCCNSDQYAGRSTCAVLSNSQNHNVEPAAATAAVAASAVDKACSFHKQALACKHHPYACANISENRSIAAYRQLGRLKMPVLLLFSLEPQTCTKHPTCPKPQHTTCP
jgi:hypothetical protein